MGKTIRNSHIVGEAGVIRFANYCNQHTPYLIFRETTRSDFGIDGEVELSRTNEDGKREPTGEIVKVQIKSVNSDASYIKNEKETYFEFHPREDDLDYWEKYISKGIPVALVIYDARNDKLYCKKISDTDRYIGKQTVKKGKALNRITFSKEDNLLTTTSDFTSQYSNVFKNRVNYDVKETMVMNFLKLKYHPRLLYSYVSKFKSKKDIYDRVNNDEAPYFVLSGDKIYTFAELGVEYSKFRTEILADSEKNELLTYEVIITDRQLRNRYSELLNVHLDAVLRRKMLVFSKDYKRYYFRKPKEADNLIVDFTTRKRRDESTKEVVKFFTYGKSSFYRHVAVEFKYQYVARDIFLIVCPKYLFTQDGKTVLPPKDITKYTNFLTAREFNSQFCDWLNFWWSYLAKDNLDWIIYEHPEYKTAKLPLSSAFMRKYPRIYAFPFQEQVVDFGIYLDKQERKKKPDQESNSLQSTLF